MTKSKASGAVPLRALGRPAASLPGLASGPVGPARAGSGLRPSLPPLPGGAARCAATPIFRQSCAKASDWSLWRPPASLRFSRCARKAVGPARQPSASPRPFRVKVGVAALRLAPRAPPPTFPMARLAALANAPSPTSAPPPGCRLDRGCAPGHSESSPRLAPLVGLRLCVSGSPAPG